MEASIDPLDGANVLVGHTVGDVFVIDETLSTTTPVLVGVLMTVVFFGISGFLITKAIQTHAQLANSMPIPVSRLAGSDTIEDIFGLGKRSTDADDSPDVNPEPPVAPRRVIAEKPDNVPVPLATPHKHSMRLHFRKPQITSMESMDLSTPLLVPPSASSSTPNASPQCTPDSTLRTPPPAPTRYVQKARRVLDDLANRSLSAFTTGFADLEVENEKYLGNAMDLTHQEGWGGFGYWSEVYRDEVFGEDEDRVQDAWYTGENEFHGWAFPVPVEIHELDKTA
ncbi:hypothetical protein GSI_01702 [Ganoderma sinense ZZ0214-1]|uniref:Uncharacterized protein n=1 Tax=Ganoderma sinense ZZ0214-1 TaxID=1077348 RepID=A0A2G8SQL8_9APHY|nr:hypothetical protein GSI_01702 [Ganoderma sinense ZZ0214-1]